jgi:hypothetical protein
MHDPIQEQVDSERQYAERKSRLDTEENALRAEHKRLTETPSGPNEETLARLRALLSSEVARSRQALRAAVNGDDPEALRKLISPALFGLFPREVEAALIPLVAGNSAAKAKRLAEINDRLHVIAKAREAIFDEHRVASVRR